MNLPRVIPSLAAVCSRRPLAMTNHTYGEGIDLRRQAGLVRVSGEREATSARPTY